ncbi:hypothetical protein DFJ58DRAFT_727565 [Suillus subalutaceus]|uniref:uncharacterized protein n=1 Tax=Suillus subalutaceus TaxID=48586 RepID=UPI001B866C4D|nr:uncharacterized protein DFJ58DRAFT_727565 [Suillus subalutaceus]KAG1855361.1 hypothetical protein DFJ58DRAFT_727565 [Suillus subalutaceus]
MSPQKCESLHRYPFYHLTLAGTGTCCGKPKVPVPWSNIIKGQSRFISSTYLPDDTKILEPSKMLRTDANAILDFWWDRQETQVGPTFRFKAWMDEKGRMCSPVAEDESDGDADDESTSARPTRKPLATTTSSTKEECDKTDAEASPPAVQQCLHGCANAEDTDRSDDLPVPKSFGKCARGHKDQPSVSHHRTPPTAKTIISVPHVTEESDQSTEASRVACSFGPRSTRRALTWTRAARDASPVVQERQPKNVPATRDRAPRKAKSARFAPGVPSDAPEKGTRSNAENTQVTRTQQKPKRYTDYI